MILSTYSTSHAHPTDKPNILSEAAILIDAKSGQVLFDKYATSQMYPASITKVVTGIIAIEEGDLKELVQVSKNATDIIGTRVYLLENEKVELKRLVQGLLINSGNDAGTVIAEHFAGSEQGFATIMNEFVKKKVGVTNSNFMNPHGLFDENHYTTAYDMAKIAQYAMKNEIFKEIVGTKELEWKGKGWETTLYNHHRLLWDYEGVTGIKNGFVPQSGFTLVTSAEQDGVELIVVTLNASSSQHAYNDTIALLNYGFGNFSTRLLPAGQTFENTSGKQYRLDSETFITVPKDGDILEEIDGDSLIIKAGGTILLEKKLSEVEESDEEFKEVKIQPQELNWFQRVINVLSIFK